jgi:hypothetical protein
VERRLKEGRGQGKGAEYKPWLQIQDVPSRGLVSRIKGWKTGREHHLMSNLESNFFYILEWSPLVLDIREQFPLLPLEETQTIAEQCGFAHPADPQTREPVVMTTDFVIILQQDSHQVEQARDCKSASDLQSQRVLEKLEIGRRYWERRNVDWQIVTEGEIPMPVVENVKWLHPYYQLQDLAPLSQADIRRIERVLAPQAIQNNTPLTKITNTCDEQLGLTPGTSLSVVRYLIANRRWLISISQRIQPSEKLTVVSTTLVDADKGGEIKNY